MTSLTTRIRRKTMQTSMQSDKDLLQAPPTQLGSWHSPLSALRQSVEALAANAQTSKLFAHHWPYLMSMSTWNKQKVCHVICNLNPECQMPEAGWLQLGHPCVTLGNIPNKAHSVARCSCVDPTAMARCTGPHGAAAKRRVCFLQRLAAQ